MVKIAAVLREKSGDAAFDLQGIPSDPSLLSVSDYKRFLEERRRRIAARINEFLGCTTSA